jgi:hypothetical protein
MHLPADPMLWVAGTMAQQLRRRFASTVFARSVQEAITMETKTLTGSCLCGSVRYTVQGEPQRALHCHCSRCRKATGTGHASNLFVAGTLTWDAGEELVRHFKVPQAQRFTNAFCSECGGRVPSSAPGSGMVMIPMGSLDVDPGIEPQARIFQGSRAAWSCSDKVLPGFDAMPG